jgi:hypothetical protein
MAANRLRRRRRDEQPTPLDLLLDDPETIRAANAAFALADRPDSAAWPFVVSVGLETVALRWAGGTSLPEPSAPWRPGHDPRVWVADRPELALSDAVAVSGSTGTAVLVGWFEETVVCVNTSRAPGPIAVDGGDDAAGLLRELIARQTGDQARTPHDGPGAWWPMDIGGDVIQLLGLAVARTFAPQDSRRAAELIRLAAALEAVRRSEAEAAGMGARAASGTMTGLKTVAAGAQTQAEDSIEAWLNQVKAAAAQATRAAHGPRGTNKRAATVETPVSAVDAAEAANVVSVAPRPEPARGPAPAPMPEPTRLPRPAPSFALDAMSMSASSAEPAAESVPVAAPAPATAGEPVPARRSSQAPAPDDLDDWAAGFAVSSADHRLTR